jgi:hypothetical protein
MLRDRWVRHAVILAIGLVLWVSVEPWVSMVFALILLAEAAARPFLTVADWYGARAAGRSVAHMVTLPQALREHGWDGVRVLRVCTARGGIAYLVRPPLGLTLEQQSRALRDIPDRLGVFEATLTAGRRSGSVWVTLRHHDPLEEPRPWTHTTAPDGEVVSGPVAGVVGRYGNGDDLVVGPGLGHIAVQGNTASGKTYLLRMIMWFWLSWDYPISGSDLSSDLLGGLEGDHVAVGAHDPAEHLRVVEELVLMMDELLTARRHGQQVFPPRLVVIEELPGLLARATAHDNVHGLKGGARLAPRLELALGRLAAESLKVGFTLLVAAQRWDASLLGGQVRNNFAVRLSLRGDRASVTMLHPDARDDLVREHSTLPPGWGLVEMPGLPLTRFRTDSYDRRGLPPIRGCTFGLGGT